MGIEIHTDTGAGELRLCRAILLYGDASRNANQGHVAIQHATIHPVRHLRGDAPQIQPGQLLTRDALGEALAALASAGNVRPWSFVQSNVVASGTDMVAWHTPATKRHMVFAGSGLNAGATAAQPPMLWVTSRRHLWVFALASDDRPGGDAPVFHAPHWNVWQGGQVCLGSAVLPQDGNPQAWTDMFYATAFTHPNDGANWQAHWRGGVTALWKKLLAEGGRRDFPMRALVPTGATVEQIVEGIMSTGVKQARGGVR